MTAAAPRDQVSRASEEALGADAAMDATADEEMMLRILNLPRDVGWMFGRAMTP